ncbi:DUF3987 domain-containing protein, partial [Parvibaculum sp.]|uniref:DUF3987 domain-containing protein n=1 Tax=Parvibaculum sp. TaxID=2024848 RepID=UPI003299B029
GKHRFVVETPLHITPLNLQLLVAAPTGAGKESARDIAERAAGDSDMLFMREPASASALHDTLNDHPNCVVAIDEFGQYLQAADAAKGHDYQMTQLLMQAFTSAHKSLPARRYANSKNQKPAVPHPYINGLYTTTAIELVEGLGKTATGSGFLGRMLILWMDETPRLRELHECGYVPDDCAIQEVMKRLADWQLPEGEGFGDTRFWYGWEKRPFWKIPLTVEAHDYYARVRHYFDEQMKTDLPSVRPLWSRALETALRVAGCVALGNAAWNDRISDVMVDLATLQYAVRLVVYSIQRFAPEAEEFTAVDKFDQLQKRIIKQVKTHAGEDGWTSRTDVLNNAKGGGFSYRQASEEMEGMIDPDGYGLLRPRVDEHGKSYTPAMVKLTERALGLQPQQTRTLENTLTDFTPPEGL